MGRRQLSVDRAGDADIVRIELGIEPGPERTEGSPICHRLVRLVWSMSSAVSEVSLNNVDSGSTD
jgi:hypothetical protein